MIFQPMRKFLFIFLFFPFYVFSQTVEEKIKTLQQQINILDEQKNQLFEELSIFKLQKVRLDLKDIGLPKTNSKDEIICHSAMCLVYDENHEQAKWVAHIILPDIINGKEGRSNDFRRDTLIKTGSAEETDYFTKTKGNDGKIKYNGFGYDRGHLAPSADFKWSKKALSESYLYSNISPQLPDFNRNKWADLEAMLREYVVSHQETQLFVVTGPILYDTLPVISQGKNQVTIPEFFYKVALDLTNHRAIGFIMPNKDANYPVPSYSVAVNDIEKITGLDFFYQLNDSLEEALESQKTISDWLPKEQKNDVPPIIQSFLQPGVFNTVSAKNHINSNKTISVVGTVVEARETRNGHLLFHLDKHNPNSIFNLMILKKNIVNFSYNPLKELLYKPIRIKGKIGDFDGIPTMFLDKENQISLEPTPKMRLILE